MPTLKDVLMPVIGHVALLLVDEDIEKIKEGLEQIKTDLQRIVETKEG